MAGAQDPDTCPPALAPEAAQVRSPVKGRVLGLGALPKLEPGELEADRAMSWEPKAGQQLLPEDAPFIMRSGSLTAQAGSGLH